MNISNLSVDEQARYVTNLTREQLEEAFVALAANYLSIEEAGLKQDRYYESAMEQSEFRADVLRNIQLKVARDFRYRETKELCKEIVLEIENSYVEL